MEIPEAFGVLVVGLNIRIRLTLRENGIWTGEVETGPAGIDMRLCAEMYENFDLPITILLYQVRI